MLLTAIKSGRQSSVEKQKPIIFICHSLSGLVFKQVRACRCTQRNMLTKKDRVYEEMLDNNQGVLFFATPHRCSDLASWDLVAARAMKAATTGYTTRTWLSRKLKVDSETLKDTSRSFAYLGGKFHIRSFYETELVPGFDFCVSITLYTR